MYVFIVHIIVHVITAHSIMLGYPLIFKVCNGKENTPTYTLTSIYAHTHIHIHTHVHVVITT